MNLRRSVCIPILLALHVGCAGAAIEDEESTGSVEQSILNGTPVTSDPVGMVYIKLNRLDGKTGFCSGVALTNNWILTAKHCMAGVNAEPARISVVKFGNETYANPIVATEVVRPSPGTFDPDAALVRLSRVLFNMAGFIPISSSVANHVWPGNTADMLNSTQSCFGYGQGTMTGPPGDLRRGDLVVTELGTDFYRLGPESGPVHMYEGDSGGPCVYFAGAQPLLAGTFSSHLVDPFNGDITNHVVSDPSIRQLVDRTLFSQAVAVDSAVVTKGFSASLRSPGNFDLVTIKGSVVSGRPYKASDGTFGNWWTVPGIAPAAAPSSVSWRSDRIDLFVRDLNGRIQHNFCNGAGCGATGFTGWADVSDTIGPSFNFGTAVTSWGVNRLDVFAVRGNDLMHRVYDNGWQTWHAIGGSTNAAPAAVAWGPNRLDVFYRTMNGDVEHKWCNGACTTAGDWFGPESLGGNLISAPAVSSFRPGRIDLFGLFSNSRLQHLTYEAGWDGWNDLGGLYQSGGLAAVSWTSGRIHVFGIGSGGRVQRQFRPR